LSWDQLDLEIAEMFDEYTWRRDDYQEALEQRRSWEAARRAEQRSDPLYLARKRKQQARYRDNPVRRRQAVEACARWRKENPDKARAKIIRDTKSRRQRAKTDPVLRGKLNAYRNRYTERNREHMREVWKRNAKAYRERKRAQQQTEKRKAV
jgi:hypothetical protein